MNSVGAICVSWICNFKTSLINAESFLRHMVVFIYTLQTCFNYELVKCMEIIDYAYEGVNSIQNQRFCCSVII